MSLREVRLLLVDDDPSAIQVMSRMLHQYPGQRFATSGEVALRMARDATPDLIVLDMEMPGMSGLDVCAALKADPVLAAVPVIIATSHATPAIEAAALRAGAADFVSKPLIAAQLTVRVRAQLRVRQLVEDLEREWLAVGAPPLPAAHQTPRLLIVDDDVASIQVLQHSSHSILVDGLLDAGPSANCELRMPSDVASSRSGRRRLRRAGADTAIAGAPIAAATMWAPHEKDHAECDQQERADQVKHPDGDEAEVLGDAERSDDDECDREDSHDLVQGDCERGG